MGLGEYRIALDGVVRSAASSIGRLILALYAPADRDGSIQNLAPALTDSIRTHRSQAYQHAVQMVREEAAAHGVEAPYIPAESGYSEQSVRTVLKEDLRGSPDEAVSIIAPKFGQHVEDAARHTVVRAVEEPLPAQKSVAAPPDSFEALRGLHEVDRSTREQYARTWARVLTGAENCGFCMMLAARGPVYGSAEKAGRILASSVWDDSARGFVKSYHPHCDCLVVPVYNYSKWPGRESWQAAEKFFKSTVLDAEWEDEKGRMRQGITAKQGPGWGKNKVITALDRELARMEREEEDSGIPDIRAA